MTTFEQFDPTSTAWVFGSTSDLTVEQEHLVREQLGAFVRGWHAHNVPLRGAADVLDHRFVVASVAAGGENVSGCSIDTLYGAIKKIEKELGVSLLDSTVIHYRDGNGRVHSASREEFKRLAESGAVTPSTPVFDLSITTLGELRSSAFEKRAGESWHSRYFAAVAS